MENLVSKKEFNEIAGKTMPASRDMKTFNGDKFQCACGKTHIFQKEYIVVINEGFNGRFIVVCPDNNNLISLIKTKIEWGIFYKGFEYLAGTRI